ncbi:hypothetical protein EJB05_26651, partial [Eragrostis curvula]
MWARSAGRQLDRVRQTESIRGWIQERGSESIDTARAGPGSRRSFGTVAFRLMECPTPTDMPFDPSCAARIGSTGEREDFQEITLTRKFRVDDEGVNFQNEKLIKIFNDLIKIGQRYSEITKVVGKKQTNEMEILKNNFAEVVKKVKPQEAAVIKSGGQPFPLPGPMFSKLPNELKVDFVTLNDLFSYANAASYEGHIQE